MTYVDFTDDMTLGEARDALRELAMHGGAKCPCCRQLAKVYRRNLTSVAARAVTALYRDHGLTFGHMPTVARHRLPDVAHQGGYLVLGAHWDLIEEERELRPDGGRAGWWRVTDLGEAWVRGHATVPKYAHVYDGRCLRVDGEQVTIEDALGARFSYAELMGLETDCKIEDTRLLVSSGPVVSEEPGAITASGHASPGGQHAVPGSSETTGGGDQWL